MSDRRRYLRPSSLPASDDAVTVSDCGVDADEENEVVPDDPLLAAAARFRLVSLLGQGIARLLRRSCGRQHRRHQGAAPGQEGRLEAFPQEPPKAR